MARFGRLNIRRIVANAIARRIAYVIVAAALAWLGLTDARAAVCGMPTMVEAAGSSGSGTAYPSRQPAYEACAALVGTQMVNNTAGNVISNLIRCERNGTQDSHRWVLQGTGQRFNSSTCVKEVYADTATRNGSTGWAWASECAAGQEWNQFTNKCQATCATRTATTVSSNSIIPNGSVGCVNGCEAMYWANGDGTYQQRYNIGSGRTCSVVPNACSNNGPNYFLNAGLGVCQPQVEECAADQIKDPITGICTNGCPTGMHADPSGVCVVDQDDCPAGNVRSPSGVCLPGDGQCAAGEARRPNGTCGRDADGDGEADEDDEDSENDPDKESASGGDSCNAPPSCSGGAIACMQVKIQWRIDCNTRRKVTVSGGACTAMPVCTGENCDAMQYSQLLQQWRSACNLEKLLAQDGNEGEGGQPEWTKVNGMSQDPGAGETAEDLPQLRELAIDVNDLDQSGFGGGSGCAGFVSSGGSGLGSSFTNALASPPAFFCNYIALIRGAIILIGAISAVTILLRGGR